VSISGKLCDDSVIMADFTAAWLYNLHMLTQLYCNHPCVFTNMNMHHEKHFEISLWYKIEPTEMCFMIPLY